MLELVTILIILPMVGVLQVCLFQLSRGKFNILGVLNSIEKSICPGGSSIQDILHDLVVNLDFISRQRGKTDIFILSIKKRMLLGVIGDLFFVSHFLEVLGVK